MFYLSIFLIRTCLENYIQKSEDILNLQCPSCNARLLENDIKSVLDTNSFEKFQLRQLYQTEINVKNRFHCLTPNCSGFCIIENDSMNNIFKCLICSKSSCALCKSIHSAAESKCELKKKAKSDSVEVFKKII